MARANDELVIREMGAGELVLVETIHAAAFGRDTEARLPHEIISAGHDVISVVALDGDYFVAHALFTALEGADRALALGPVAVVPDRQGHGIGVRLVRFGLDLARRRGWRSVFVLGDPAFYGRLGFRADLARGAIVPWAGPNFQALELDPGALSGWSGILVYPKAFGSGEDETDD
ncbi:N-acetyltransferase [Aureimonas sp. ME7]|uniref:GNAT family N-acetyltransferase n=1 Tax=Aureimonas sp. ME7 TaxID=2744252 RepID=UPI0015F40E27|nr:N-acetyltransferase [Aureimonas sp. ME7]